MQVFLTISRVEDQYFVREWEADSIDHATEQFKDADMGELLISCVPAGTSVPFNSKSDTRPLKELAVAALHAQSAVNLSGIVYAFASVMKRLRKLEPNQGTDFYNQHPICVLFAEQISFLTRREEQLNYSNAYDWCSTLIEKDFKNPYTPRKR